MFRMIRIGLSTILSSIGALFISLSITVHPDSFEEILMDQALESFEMDMGLDMEDFDELNNELHGEEGEEPRFYD